MLTNAEQRFLAALSELAYCNPFQPERLEWERTALGREYQDEELIAWSRDVHRDEVERPNVVRLTARAEQLVDRLRAGLAAGDSADDETLGRYQDLVSYVLYYRHVATIDVDELFDDTRKTHQLITGVWRAFARDLEHFLSLPGRDLPLGRESGHLFACLYQLRRAFRFIFDNILGDSQPAVRLRAAVWQSVFTHDMRRYRRALYDRMRELTTLVTGPSGTGKELVARAIGLSQYIPFDAQQERFAGDLAGAFQPVNLSAFSPTLIESELFGHCRGAFTGALADRRGWLECCPVHGAVFLDEIGDLDPMLQVKLLRVAQSGAYSRIGEAKESRFVGKLLAATNRDLAEEIRAGRFREDLFYRLCSDRIETPSLRDHLHDRPEALGGLIAHITRRLVGREADALTLEVQAWIDEHIGADYRWPGNIRELEQCVRNVLVRKQYVPQPVEPEPRPADKSKRWLIDAERGRLTHAELLAKYCTWVYARLGSYQQTADALGLDRRTVRSKIDHDLLESIALSSRGA